MNSETNVPNDFAGSRKTSAIQESFNYSVSKKEPLLAHEPVD